MEVKKTAAMTPREVEGKKVFEYFGDLKKEFKNVSWTPKHELQAYTKVVVGTTFVFGFLIYLTDLFIQGALNGLNLFAKLIGG